MFNIDEVIDGEIKTANVREKIVPLQWEFSFTPNAAVLFVDVAVQPEVRFIAKQNSLMKIGNNGNLVLGPFDESTRLA
ncbi:hypothetical protein TNCV_2687621 [Trichonephila clavipes]|nr:hypothetical protein TNCV_2687621 [Trichonephila clavipes]